MAAEDNSLCVAIVFEDYPVVLIDEDKSIIIKEALEDHLRRNCNKMKPPCFCDNKLYLGALLVECADKYSRVWLEVIITTLNVGEKASLRAVEKSALDKTKRVSLLVPGSPRPTNVILGTLAWQNPSIAVKKWLMESCVPNPNGLRLVFRMDENSFNILENNQFSAFYMLTKLTFDVLEN